MGTGDDLRSLQEEAEKQTRDARWNAYVAAIPGASAALSDLKSGGKIRGRIVLRHQ